MQFTANLAAGTWQRQDTAGALFVLLDTGAAASVEVRLMRGTVELENITTAERGLKARTAEGFTHVELRASVPTSCVFVISNGAVDFDFVTGTSVDVQNVAGTRLLVSNDRGTPDNLLHVAGVTLADAPATSVINGAAVACGPLEAVIAAADGTRRALRITNLGPDPVTIGAAGITWAGRCVVLEAGDVWIEDRGANLAWSAITDAGKAASVTRQEVKA